MSNNNPPPSQRQQQQNAATSRPAPLPPPRQSSPLAPRAARRAESALPAPGITRIIMPPRDSLDDPVWTADDIDLPDGLSELLGSLRPPAATRTESTGGRRSVPNTLSSSSQDQAPQPRPSSAAFTLAELLGPPARSSMDPRAAAAQSPWRRLPSHQSLERLRGQLQAAPLGMSFPNDRIDDAEQNPQRLPWGNAVASARRAGYPAPEFEEAIERMGGDAARNHLLLSLRMRQAREAFDATAQARRRSTGMPALGAGSGGSGQRGNSPPPASWDVYGRQSTQDRMAAGVIRRRGRPYRYPSSILVNEDPESQPTAPDDHIWEILGMDGEGSDDDEDAGADASTPSAAQRWGLYRGGEPIGSTRARDADDNDSVRLVPGAMDDTELDGWGGHGERGTQLSRGRFNRRRASFHPLYPNDGIASLDDIAIDFSTRVRPSDSRGVRRRRSVDATEAEVINTDAETGPDSSQSSSAKRQRREIPQLSRIRPSYLSFTTLPSTLPLPNDFAPPLSNSHLELTRIDAKGDLPPRPVITFGSNGTPDGDPYRQQNEDSCALRSDHPIPPGCGVYYYEVDVLSEGEKKYISVGWMLTNTNLRRLVGWDPGTWGWHSDDGKSFEEKGSGVQFSEPWFEGDTVGCGIDFTTGRAFFTKNGKLIGHVFSKLPQNLYPSVGLRSPGESVAVNFTGPFKYDIDSHVQAIQQRVRQQVFTKEDYSFCATPRKSVVPKLAGLPSVAYGKPKETVKEEPATREPAPAVRGAKKSGGEKGKKKTGVVAKAELPELVSYLPAESPLQDGAPRAQAALVLDYLRTRGHTRISQLLASDMAKRGWLEPRPPVPDLKETPSDAANPNVTKDDYLSVRDAVRAAVEAVEGTGRVPWSLLRSLDVGAAGLPLNSRRVRRFKVYDFAVLAREAAECAMRRRDEEPNQSQDAGMAEDESNDGDLDIYALEAGRNLRRATKMENWDEDDKHLLDQACALLADCSGAGGSTASDALAYARMADACELEAVLNDIHGLKTTSCLERAVAQTAVVLESRTRRGDGTMSFVSLNEFLPSAGNSHERKAEQPASNETTAEVSK